MINTKLYGIYKNNIYEMGSSFDDTNLIFIYTIDQSAIDDTFENANSMGWYKKRIDKSEIEKEVRIFNYIIIDGVELEVLEIKEDKILVASIDPKIAKKFGLEITRQYDFYSKWIDADNQEIKKRVLEHVYSGHGCLIEKCMEDYYMSWQVAYFNREVTYKIPQNLIEKVKLSCKDTYKVAKYLRTGEWETEYISNRGLIDSYLEKSPNVLLEIIKYRRYFTEDELKELLSIAKEIEKEARFIENCRIIVAIILLLLIFGGIFIAKMKAPSTPKIADCINDTQLQNEIKEESIEILKKEYKEYINSDIGDKATISFKYLKRYRDKGLNSEYTVSYDNKLFTFYIKNDEIHFVHIPNTKDFLNYNEIKEIIQ